MASTGNIRTTLSSSDPSSCSEHRWKCQVFLSFRGETRNTFTSHLCNELSEKFITTFKRDERLEIGTPITKALLDAIEKSRIAVIIISEEYASSTRCLEELAKIVECMNDREMKVVPIFYHVKPSDARHQKGTFGDAFAQHEKNLKNEEKVQTWRNALKQVANLSGYLVNRGDDYKFYIESIVRRISIELSQSVDLPDNLVGMDSRVKEMYLLCLDIGSNDARFIGICGMSGMGKTTLARVIFQKFNHLFRARSFLENVSLVSKRNGLVALQEKLLSDMKLKDDQERWDVQMGIAVIRNRLYDTKVLIVLDDVDKIEQLQTLAGNCNWFGPGSRIIVTTRDSHLLIRHGVKIIYRMKGLHEKEALLLFTREAFGKPDECETPQELLDLCKDYVNYANGHPFALKVLGSFLFGKGKKEWESLLDKLQVLPNREIQEKLKIGFDALGDTEKKMFLDIACFFNGEDKHRVVDLLEGTSDCFPDVDILTLVDKSLITILGNKLCMHSLLQRMGWEIVRCEHQNEPGKRSRLWRRDEILEVLQENSGTDKVQGIILSTSSPHREEELNPEAFSNMKNLRLIKICDVNLPRGLNSLSNQLRLMEWHKYPLGSIPESFQPSNLVELIMHRSGFLQLPTAFLKLKKLKVMDFSGSENLMMTPDFSGCPSLQRLVFKGCIRLSEVHPSIGALKHLILLNLEDCKCLSSLPHEINLESLNILILSDCSKFDKFPEIGQNMKHLSELYLDGTAIEELPLSIQYLTGLTLLNLGGCKKLLILPSVIDYLPALKTLIFSTPSSDHSSCLEHQCRYEVFLSFGCETRNTFTSHLCNELSEKFINTLKGDERLEIGTPITKAHLDVIEKSRIAVIIISKEYASSTWCLEELAKILECWKDRKMIVLPIFYRVKPSDVRKPEDTFRDAFAKHEQNPENKEKVQTWRNALKKVANLSGYLVDRGDELTVIKIIVETISRIMMNLVDDHEDNLVSDMASTSNIQTTPSSDPSSCSEHRWKYEVFLSFGCKTRNTFTSYLCNELRKKFIYTFKDDDSLDIGGPIKKELLDAIEKSRMAVIIISKEYASSTWCLEELVKIVECMNDREMKVVPIFYHVDPSDVRKQDDTFRDAFAEHEKNLGNKDKVQTWRNALKEVANLSGYHLKCGDEPTVIKIIVRLIFRKLSDLIDDHDEDLVRIDSPVNEYLHYFAIGSNDVHFIGIVGISGMGKTTLARVIFQKFNDLFRASSFLEDVSFVSKRSGLVALQENLLTDMKLKDDQEKWDVLEGIDVIRNRLRDTKVLIVLDDVDEKEQLEALAGNCNWFGPGSRIIVTTRDEYLLTTHGVQIIYQMKGLHKNEALQLFSREAFRKPDECEDQDFMDLCNDYVSYSGGHPLTLKVLGSSLLGRGRKVWKSSLDSLQKLPDGDIQHRLKIGYDALGDTEKNMFLDIACFFNGEDKDRVVDLLEDSDCFPNIDIETLMDKSLITILGRKLRMHSLLQEMGRKIVCGEYPQPGECSPQPGERSRLWCWDDILEVLRENSGTYKVQGIMLSTSSPHREEEMNPEAFSNMKNLRLIKICDVNLPRGLNSLSNRLRLMEWHKYPLGSIPESFQPSNLVELIMHRSGFLQLPPAFLKLKKLKVMDFSGSENLMMTPDFSGCPSLQRLVFKGCIRLSEVHPSIGALKHLILLNLKDCKCLSSLPREINLESLNILILSGCSKFDKFPEIGQNMKHLSEFYLDGTAIEELPLSIQYLTGLTLLNLGGCKKLLIFPSVICCLPALKTLILSGCRGQPPSPVLFYIGAPLTLSLPSFFSRLTSLVALDLSDCNLLDGALPDDLSGLSSLESLNLSRNNFTRLPDSISQLPKLKFIYLDNCSRLQLLPNLPSTIQLVMTRECTSL